MALPEGLRAGHGGRNLTTVHPGGRKSSSTFHHDERWLDFNMIQSGHWHDAGHYLLVAADHLRAPVKPTLDAESFYEEAPEMGPRGKDKPRVTDYDMRKGAYLGVFASGFGATCGHNSIWQMWGPGLAGHGSTAPKTRGKRRWTLPAARRSFISGA
jgi:hypothetical protein